MYNREINRLVKQLNAFVDGLTSEEKAFTHKMLLQIGEAIKKENPKFRIDEFIDRVFGE